MQALQQIDAWEVPHAAAAVVTSAGVVAAHGDVAHSFRLASIAKLLTAYAFLVAVEEGSITLDEGAGPPGATVRHLLSHAAGYGFDGPDPIAPVGRRRIYSNTGIEVAARHLSDRTGIAFRTYLAEAVFEPLGMTATELRGSPAHGVWSTLGDVGRFAAELQAPRLVTAATLAEATTSQFPTLAGILPELGRHDPLDWGLGFEIRGHKRPHWTGTTNSPGTFGHFGGAGTFVWVDGVAGCALVCLTDREFGPWAIDAWPPFSDAVLGEVLGA